MLTKKQSIADLSLTLGNKYLPPSLEIHSLALCMMWDNYQVKRFIHRAGQEVRVIPHCTTFSPCGPVHIEQIHNDATCVPVRIEQIHNDATCVPVRIEQIHNDATCVPVRIE